MKRFFALFMPILLLVGVVAATPANAQFIDWSHANVTFPGNNMVINDLRFLGESFSACWELNGTTGDWILQNAVTGATGNPCDGAGPVDGQTSTVAVCVTDATTGDPLSGASVSLDSFSDTTGSDGCVEFSNVPYGTYSAQASAMGFVDSSTSATVSQPSQTIPISLSPIQAEGEWRIVLTWGEFPRDLDSHLLVPGPPGYHIAFYDRGDLSAYPFANLDVDDVTSFGPETVTIVQPVAGIYRYYVHLWCCLDQAQLSASQAVVTLFSGAAQIASWTVPRNSGENLWWHVFDLNAMMGPAGLVSVNNFVSVEPSAP
ncbi:MAG: carboxypeptidase regulatory-like domain-containing protein [Deltaproteobacteria bacterium]|nr:carboxypeptidase regulatory-like domain-containing protein [Deltaproteobacteria bacterium]